MPLSILFPRKCTLCRKLLTRHETDLCHDCRKSAPVILNKKRNIPFIAQWTAVWYYKDGVGKSIRRFKFSNARSYADVFARHIAMCILESDFADRFDCITWAPVSFLRRLKRGYDQSELLAMALSKETGVEAVRLLKKVRHTPAQSTLKDASKRRANVLNAYRATSVNAIAGRRILLLDDVLTTGATASECARTLLTAGAREVYFASIAATGKE